eukprot:g67634.t1
MQRHYNDHKYENQHQQHYKFSQPQHAIASQVVYHPYQYPPAPPASFQHKKLQYQHGPQHFVPAHYGVYGTPAQTHESLPGLHRSHSAPMSRFENELQDAQPAPSSPSRTPPQTHRRFNHHQTQGGLYRGPSNENLNGTNALISLPDGTEVIKNEPLPAWLPPHSIGSGYRGAFSTGHGGAVALLPHPRSQAALHEEYNLLNHHLNPLQQLHPGATTAIPLPEWHTTSLMTRSVSNGSESTTSSLGRKNKGTGADESKVDPRKNKPIESPASKNMFKSFYKEFWQLAKEDPVLAHEMAVEKLPQLPKKIHWRVCMEVADLAKRQNRVNLARHWYAMANQLEPCAAQAWLEHAKLEEECGELRRCQRIVSIGLEFCEYNESLIVKAIKHFERLGNIEAARAVLARLKHGNIEKVWRTVLEGALLEARVGSPDVARRIFKYLMLHVPWYGPVFYEACRFEEKLEEDERALFVAEKGLAAVPKYGPLWFIAFRLYQKTSKGDMEKPRRLLTRALQHISSDVVWKLHFEAAHMEEQYGLYEESRRCYAEAIRNCPPNLVWKAWLSGSRMELRAGRTEVAELLLQRALATVPKKSRAVVLMEKARVAEFFGDLEQARTILNSAKEETQEWKLYFEMVLLEARAGRYKSAIKAAEEALKVHSGTGRLWAILIQLNQLNGYEEQMKMFRRAIKEVPKSGEVWCEGARIRLDPTSPYFNLKAAHKFLKFAIEFTPQYGDSFIEFLRLKMLLLGRNAAEPCMRILQMCANAEPNYGSLWFHCKQHTLDTANETMARAVDVVTTDLKENRPLYQQAILDNWYKGSTGSNRVVSLNSSLPTETPRAVSKSCSPETPAPRRDIAQVLNMGPSPAHPKANKSPSKRVLAEIEVIEPSENSNQSNSANSPVSLLKPKNIPSTTEQSSKELSAVVAERVRVWQRQGINSLYVLYPQIQTLSMEQRHMIMFGADRISP